ncbi:hypothetical protein [Candidatus Enterovibrio luxaltus]
MVRVKKLLGRTLSLRYHNAQISETYTIIKTLNKPARLSMPKTKAII